MKDIISNVDKITDSLGKGIDTHIKELVVLLNYHKVITRASCEGHSNWGLSYPWIDFEYSSLNTFLMLMQEFKYHYYIHLTFLKHHETKKLHYVRIIPENRKIEEGRKQFKLLENFLKEKII